MQALERAAFANGTVTSRQAMERAGQGVAAAILGRLAGPAPALVLCGPGNNGGDGYVIARALAAAGWPVTVLALGMPAGADALAMRALWDASGPAGDLLAAPLPADPAVTVDAVFGIGLARPLAGALVPRLDAIARLAAAAGALRVAVDLPSGLDADTGKVLGTTLPADLTVTFHLRKPAHVIRRDLCGQVEVVDIGL